MNPLIHELFQNTRLISRELNQALKAHDLFAAQWTVLFCVDQHGEMSLTQIWKYLNVEAPTITRTVNRLEELGWLITHPGKDKREKIERLSEMAETKIPAIKESVIEFEQSVLKGLSVEEQTVLAQLLKKMTKGS